MKRTIVFLLAICVMLAGCNLAQEESREDGVEVADQLVGMLITLDLFVDEEPDIYEDLPVWNPESSGMEDPLHYATNQGKRLYAELVPEEYEVDGETYTTMRYVFPEGTGIPHMTFLILGNGERENYWSYVDGLEICDGNRHIKVVDDETTIELSGKIYVDERATDLVLNLNPVYQTPEGEVYALGTFPMGFHAVSMSNCPQTITQEVKTAIGDEVTLSGGSVKLEIQAVTLPDTYVILEMDGDNQPVSSAEYAPEEMPQAYIPRENTAFIIMEAHSESGVTRTVYSPDDEIKRIESFYPSDFGILIRGYTSIQWEGAE